MSRAVIDAGVAAAVLAGVDDHPALAVIGEYGTLHAPAHFDAECASVLRRLYLQRVLSRDDLRAMTRVIPDLPVRRWSLDPLLDRMTDLVDNVTSYDAAYLALAEGLSADLLTSDARLSSVPDIHCTVRVL